MLIVGLIILLMRCLISNIASEALASQVSLVQRYAVAEQLFRIKTFQQNLVKIVRAFFWKSLLW
jgi:hypothetical protein